jgi:hypothetical protein
MTVTPAALLALLTGGMVASHLKECNQHCCSVGSGAVYHRQANNLVSCLDHFGLSARANSLFQRLH